MLLVDSGQIVQLTFFFQGLLGDQIIPGDVVIEQLC